MKICVIGATGGTGLHFVKLALDEGHELMALVRDPERLQMRSPRLRVVTGSVLQSATVDYALRDCEAVVSMLGVAFGQPAGTTRSTGTRVLVQAVQRSPVKRLLAVSTVGIGTSRAAQSLVSRWLLPRLIGAQRLAEADLQEQIIASSGLDWTVLRPPRLVDGPPTGRYRSGVGIHTSMSSKITRADLARALLDELVKGQFVRAATTVCS